MADAGPYLSADELAELTAFADGSLPAERRAEVEARVAASPELGEIVERQRHALRAMRPMVEEPVPASLRAEVERLRPRPATSQAARRRLLPGLALSGAAAVALAAVTLVLALGGGSAEPTVAEAAQLATKPAVGPAPAPTPGRSRALEASVEGVDFPDLRPAYGWVPTGVRGGSVDGRHALVVFYAKHSRRLAYLVVGGSPLGGTSGYGSSTYRGVRFRTFSVDGRPAVTWLRDGHTCVLIGQTTRAELLALAGHPSTRAPY
jgi:hypothetical protein